MTDEQKDALLELVEVWRSWTAMRGHPGEEARAWEAVMDYVEGLVESGRKERYLRDA